MRVVGQVTLAAINEIPSVIGAADSNRGGRSKVSPGSRMALGIEPPSGLTRMPKGSNMHNLGRSKYA